MFSSLLKKQMMRAGFLLLVSSFLLYSPAQAAPIEKVEVALDAAGGDLPPAVEKRVVSSISSIGNRVFVGKAAETLRVSRQAVSKWENGTTDPSTSNLCALAKLYGIPVEELLHETQEEKSED